MRKKLITTCWLPSQPTWVTRRWNAPASATNSTLSRPIATRCNRNSTQTFSASATRQICHRQKLGRWRIFRLRCSPKISLMTSRASRLNLNSTVMLIASSNPGYGKAFLLDFNYDLQPVEGKYPLPGIGPFSLLRETRLNHLGKLAFKWIYWNLLLRGVPMPGVGHHMSRVGKQIPVEALQPA